ncbi:nefa-interacting nuclear nip30 protein [Rutstroemia sp. NJR-2017a WRK4]|nr:nefa-interacting nuclear nip30 protein [Rutstroemia sp. NJR-2017a WRK4]PQE14925.1 nefa-interacting nuclear nip30 protein [Rutstroemia sp. NJR-2017a WRK4]
MSSGFVSGGTTDAPIERSDEWLAAQQEIEANRQKKALEARQNDGKSLFEILEANKAAKQEAFEEANKIKNQFRALDEDEVDFLDSVLESTRAEEDRVKKETAAGLELFRKQQEEADKKARTETDGAPAQEASAVLKEEWISAGRKRKRAKEKEGLKGVKIRRGSSAAEQASTPPKAVPVKAPAQGDASQKSSSSRSTAPVESVKLPTEAQPSVTSKPEEMKKAAQSPPKKGLGLVDYGSDDDDD